VPPEVENSRFTLVKMSVLCQTDVSKPSGNDGVSPLYFSKLNKITKGAVYDEEQAGYHPIYNPAFRSPG